MLVVQLIIIAAFTIYVISNTRNNLVLSPSISEWNSHWIEYTDKGWVGNVDIIEHSIDENEDFDLIYGPFIPLNKGLYTATIDYKTDWVQEFSVYSYEGGEFIHTIEKPTLFRECSSATVHFWTERDISDLEIRVKYNGIGTTQIEDIKICRSYLLFKLALLFIVSLFGVIDAVYLKKSISVTDNNGLTYVFEYRNIWMALAITLVMLFHSRLYVENAILKKIIEFGYGGVDFFFFATGAGCYLSYTRDCDAGTFMHRRIKRILPTYFTFIIPWLIYKIIFEKISFGSVLGNIFSVESLKVNGDAFNWYIVAMWLCYSFVPLMATLVLKYIYTWKRCLILIVISILFSISFWDDQNWMIIVTRIPITFLGMFIANMYSQGKTKMHIGNHIILGFLCLWGIVVLNLLGSLFPDIMWNKGFYWYPFLLIVPESCFLISFLTKLLTKSFIGQQILKPIKMLGGMTFELFLVHLALFDYFNKNISAEISRENNMGRLLVLFLSVPVARLLKYVSNTCLPLLLTKLRLSFGRGSEAS